MKSRVKKILLCLSIILFIMASFILGKDNINTDFNKTYKIESEEKYASYCIDNKNWKGKTKDVSSSLNIRKAGSGTADVIGSVPSGDTFTINCIADSWYNITYGTKTGYVSSKYVEITQYSAPWISSVSVSSSAPYENEDQTITMNASVGSDGPSGYVTTTFKLYKSTDTTNAIVTRTATGTGSKSTSANLNLAEGTYILQAYSVSQVGTNAGATSSTISASFNVGKHKLGISENISLKKVDGKELEEEQTTVAENHQGEWELSFNQKDGTEYKYSLDNMNIDNVTLEIDGNYNGTYQDATANFDIIKNATDKTITIKNKPNVAIETTYKIIVKYSDTENKFAENGFVSDDDATLTISEPIYTAFVDEDATKLYRSVPITSTSNYSIAIAGIVSDDKTGGEKYDLYENKNGTLTEVLISKANFEETYTSTDLNNVDILTVDGKKRVVVKKSSSSVDYLYRVHDEAVTVTKTDETTGEEIQETTTVRYYYYSDGTSNLKLPEDEFAATYPSIYSIYTSSYSPRDRSLKLFVTDSDGYFRYQDAGLKVETVYNLQTDKSKTPFSLTGGQFNYYIDYTTVDKSLIDSSVLYFTKTDTNGNTSDVMNETYLNSTSTVTKEDNDAKFYLTWKYDDSTKKAKLQIEYKGKTETYNGHYTIILKRKAERKFAGIPAFTRYYEYLKITFDLVEGETDYYLYSEPDTVTASGETYDIDENDPSNNYPPSNMKFKQQVGLYMIRGNKVVKDAYPDNVNYQIYDHQVEKAEDGSLVGFNQIDYVVKFLNYKDSKIKYQISYDQGVNFKEAETMDESDFATKYEKAYEMLQYYLFDEDTGDIIGDNFQNIDYGVKIVNYTSNDAGTDMQITYIEKGETEEKTSDLADFKLSHSLMYKFITTKLIFDGGQPLLGQVMGDYKEYQENGEDIVATDVSDKFLVVTTQGKLDLNGYEHTENSTSLILNVVPKKEVESGSYYIYVAYNTGDKSVGYLNDSDDAAISEDLYPDMWERNIHMAVMKYSKPKYTVDLNEPSLRTSADTISLNSNINTIEEDGKKYVEKLYTNIEGKVIFNTSLNYIYENDEPTTSTEKELGKHLTTNIEYYDEDNAKWIDANDAFNVETNYVLTEEAKSTFTKKDKYEDPLTGDVSYLNRYILDSTIGKSTITLNNIVGKVKQGKYRLTLDYVKDGKTLLHQDTTSGYSKHVYTREFEVIGEYFGLNLLTTKRHEFVHNISLTKNIELEGTNIKNPENIKFKLIRYIDEATSDSFSNEDKTSYYFDENSHEIYLNGDLAFTYDVNVVKDSEDPTNIKYVLSLTNVANVAPTSAYKLTFEYTQGGDLSTLEYGFDVIADQYAYTTNEIKATADETEKSIIVNGTTQYYSQEQINNFEYTMYQVTNTGIEEVSGNMADTRLFDISATSTDKTEENGIPTYNLKIKLKILDENNLNLKGEYYLKIKTDQDEYNVNFNSTEGTLLYDLLNWTVREVNITGIYTDSETGETENVEGFYKNLPGTQIEAILDTFHTNKPNYVITKDCLEGVCTPSTVMNYNSRFETVSFTEDGINYDGISTDKIALRLKNDLTTDQMLSQGTYAFVVYYDDLDYRVYEFKVKNEYVDIRMSDPEVITQIDATENFEGALFRNKNGYIKIPVKIKGIDYNKATVYVTDVNGLVSFKGYFSESTSKFIDDHYVYLEYNKSSQIPAGTYMVMVKYEKSPEDGEEAEITYDQKTFTVNEKFFDIRIKDPVYKPTTAVPNRDDITINFDIETRDLYNSSDSGATLIIEDLLSKLSIYNTNDMTTDIKDKFIVTYSTETSDVRTFKIILSYAKNTLEPGTYQISLTNTLSDYTVTRTKDFVISDYERNLTLGDIELITMANDKRFHRNMKTRLNIPIASDYKIETKDYNVTFIASDGNTYTDSFDITKELDNVTLIYRAEKPYIPAGTGQVNITYTDPTTGRVTIYTKEVKVYGEYKNITISNIVPSTSPIVAQNDNQYYRFTLQTDNLTTTDLENIKVRIYDEYNNIEYSDISSDDGLDLFTINKIDDANYQINILANKARVGNYYVVLCLPDEYDDYNESNRLLFTIDKNLYNLDLLDSSFITPQEVYNNDYDKYYDYIGFNAGYSFKTNYTGDISDYSIKVINNGKTIKEIKDLGITKEDGSYTYQTDTFGSDEVGTGDVEVAICINGLPYASKMFKAEEYIKVESVIVEYNNKDVNDSLEIPFGENATINYYVKPSNATNPNLTFTSSDSTILTTNNNTITGNLSGEANLTIANKEFKKVVKVKVSDRITSSVYEIDYSNNTIFVNNLTSTTCTKKSVLGNLQNVLANYTLKDSKGNDATNGNLIGTNYKLTSGTETYTMIVIGDLNGNGTIDIGDVTYVYRIYSKKVTVTNEAILKAAHVRKASTIELGDVTKLYRFYRGTVSAL